MKVKRVPFGVAIAIILCLFVILISDGETNEYVINKGKVAALLAINICFVVIPLIVRSVQNRNVHSKSTHESQNFSHNLINNNVNSAGNGQPAWFKEYCESTDNSSPGNDNCLTNETLCRLNSTSNTSSHNDYSYDINEARFSAAANLLNDALKTQDALLFKTATSMLISLAKQGYEPAIIILQGISEIIDKQKIN